MSTPKKAPVSRSISTPSSEKEIPKTLSKVSTMPTPASEISEEKVDKNIKQTTQKNENKKKKT